MAIADARRRRIGRELVDWLHLGIRTGARRAVEEYHRHKVNSPALAEDHLKRAVNMPLRTRARINEARRLYEAANGVGTFNTFIAGCLSLAGTVTLAEINSDLTALETYAHGLIARKRGGESLDSIAADIEANIRRESDDWVFPFPADYADQW